MGAVLEMMTRRAFAALALAATLTLAGCGNDGSSNDYQRPLQVALARLTAGKAAPTLATLNQSGTLTLRQALEADGQPIYRISYARLKYTNLMAPYGQNGDVQTWASQDYETVSLRAGMLVATRGFGADLMSSVGPSVARVSSAQGTTQRQYFYLDGADQKQRYDYTCVLASAGIEEVVVLAKSHATRKVTESCSGASGRFVNEFWFDNGQNLRQSRQMLVPGTDNMLLQRVID